MFGALLKLALAPDFQQIRYSKTKLILAGASGLVTTALGIGLAFFPAQQITSLFSYEVWMWGGTLLFVGAAGFFFFLYCRRQTAPEAAGEWNFGCSGAGGEMWSSATAGGRSYQNFLYCK